MEEASSGSAIGKMKRTYVRWPFACPTIELRLSPPCGSTVSLQVVARNLSASGIGLLHANFVYPDTPCTALIPSNWGTLSAIRGRVVRCQHFSGVVHEVGVEFDEPVDPSEFIDADKIGVGVRLESIDPAILRGHVLLIETSELDRKLVMQHLIGTQVRLDHAGGYDEGLERAKTGNHDLVMCDLLLDGGRSGIELVRELRSTNPGKAVLVLSADGSSIVRQHVIDAEANGLLTKPMSKDSLLTGITEFLTVGFGGGVENLRSTLVEGDERLALLPEFVRDLREKVKSLRELVQKDDAMGLYGVSLQIGGAAPAFGFDQLGMAARSASNSLAATMSAQESIKHIRALIDTCDRVDD